MYNRYRDNQVIIKFSSADVKSSWYSKDDFFYNWRYYGDFETTGFNAAGGDQMIEIGAVKIKEGIIIDRFLLILESEILFLFFSRNVLMTWKENELLSFYH